MLHKRIPLQLQWLIFSSFKWWGNVLAVSVKVSRYGWRAALNHSHVSTQLMVHQRLNMSVVRMTTATRDLFQNLIQSQNHCKVWQHDPDGLFTIICIFLSRSCAAPPYWLIRSKAQSRPTVWTLHDLHLISPWKHTKNSNLGFSAWLMAGQLQAKNMHDLWNFS